MSLQFRDNERIAAKLALGEEILKPDATVQTIAQKSADSSTAEMLFGIENDARRSVQ